MYSRSFILRCLVGLVVLTSTPGLAELAEYTLHAVVDDGGSHHHELDGNDKPCDSGCTRGMFHTCRCSGVQVAEAEASEALVTPKHAPAPRPHIPVLGRLAPAHPQPPFRPPTA